MDQELKQRLIGAAVITALAAIFVPMLFDDPIDESGKSINELKIPELPVPSYPLGHEGTQGKAQDVEIMPLPEKVEDVATMAPDVRPNSPAAPAIVEEGDDEASLEAPRPRVQISAKETENKAPPAKWAEPDEDIAAAEAGAAAVVVKPVVSAEKPKAAKTPVKTEPTKKEAPVKMAKPVTAPTPTPAPAEELEPVAKPAAAPVTGASAENSTVRWYLNAGSFSQKANAVTLQDNLKKQGFAASIKEVSSAKGSVFKVRVGPMMDKAKAQAMKSKLAQINVNSFVSGDE